MFTNQHYITKGAMEKIPLHLQLFMIECIRTMPEPKDYLQVFKFVEQDEHQLVLHMQEQPEYRKEYLLAPVDDIVLEKVFVIDDETHTTILLAEEY